MRRRQPSDAERKVQAVTDADADVGAASRSPQKDNPKLAPSTNTRTLPDEHTARAVPQADTLMHRGGRLDEKESDTFDKGCSIEEDASTCQDVTPSLDAAKSTASSMLLPS